MGLPGLALALIYMCIAVWNMLSLLCVPHDMWKTCIALLVLCILVTAFLEPFLFPRIYATSILTFSSSCALDT